MTVSPETEGKIRRAHFVDHWPIGTIATQLGVHHDVVRRVLCIDARNAAARSRAPSRPSELDPYLEFIRATLTQHPTLVSTRPASRFNCAIPGATAPRMWCSRSWPGCARSPRSSRHRAGTS